MPLEQIANIADIVGATLVVVTLVFLALQIRQNTRAVRATTIESTMQSEMKIAAIIIENAATWEKVITGAPIADGEETRKAMALYNVLMIDTESRYHQFKAGYLERQAWEGRVKTLPDVVRLPIFEKWRYSLGGLTHAADFLDFLDSLLAENSNDQD